MLFDTTFIRVEWFLNPDTPEYMEGIIAFFSFVGRIRLRAPDRDDPVRGPPDRNDLPPARPVRSALQNDRAVDVREDVLLHHRLRDGRDDGPVLHVHDEREILPVPVL